MTLKAGIIGVGMWGEVNAWAYLKHPKAELVAVADVNVERAKQFAEKYGVSKVYGSAQEMAADPAIDVVSLTTPDFAHREPALAVLAAKKHLCIAKPLSNNQDDARAIAAAAEKSGVIVGVDFHNRYNPMFQNARKAIDEGELGQVRYIYIRHSNCRSVPFNMLSWASKSSSLWFLGSHSFDLARWLMGDEIDSVYCQTVVGYLQGKGLDVPDVYCSTIRFRNGGVAMVENAWILPDSARGDFQSEIVGTEGMFYTNLSRNSANELFGATRRQNPDLIVSTSIAGNRSGFAVESVVDFIDGVLQGRPPLATWTDGLANTEALCAADLSSRLGRAVKPGEKG